MNITIEISEDDREEIAVRIVDSIAASMRVQLDTIVSRAIASVANEAFQAGLAVSAADGMRAHVEAAIAAGVRLTGPGGSLGEPVDIGEAIRAYLDGKHLYRPTLGSQVKSSVDAAVDAEIARRAVR